jgi:hypothetical protein
MYEPAQRQQSIYQLQKSLQRVLRNITILFFAIALCLFPWLWLRDDPQHLHQPPNWTAALPLVGLTPLALAGLLVSAYALKSRCRARSLFATLPGGALSMWAPYTLGAPTLDVLFLGLSGALGTLAGAAMLPIPLDYARTTESFLAALDNSIVTRTRAALFENHRDDAAH